MLLPYQLFYESTQRKFTCEFWTDMDEEYEPSYKSQSEKETENQFDIMNDKFVVDGNNRQNKDPNIMTKPSGQEEIMRKTTHIQHESYHDRLRNHWRQPIHVYNLNPYHVRLRNDWRQQIFNVNPYYARLRKHFTTLKYLKHLQLHSFRNLLSVHSIR